MPADEVGDPAADAARVPAEDELPSGLRQRLLSRGLVRAGITTYVFSGLTLIANLVSGVVVARALGPSGRGITIALTTVSQLAGFLFAMGVAQSLSYFIARRPEDGPSLFTTWVGHAAAAAAVAIGLSRAPAARRSSPTTARRRSPSVAGS